MMTDESFRQFTRSAVLKGVQLLDEHKPGWRDEIDWEALNMRSSFTCILGQLFDPGPGYAPGYWSGLSELAIHNEDAHFFGFSIPYSKDRHYSGDPDYEFLTSLWLQEAGVNL